MESSGAARDTPWAMSEQNVETLRQIAAAWNRHDLETWLGFTHPEIEWQGVFTRLEGARYRGRDGMREYWSQTNAALELVVSFDEMRDLGDTVLGLGHLRGRSQGGVPIDTQYGIVMGFQDGLAVRGSDWDSHAEALEAAGLSD
jgi:ketosteroid isomerase-like protein